MTGGPLASGAHMDVAIDGAWSGIVVLVVLWSGMSEYTATAAVVIHLNLYTLYIFNLIFRHSSYTQ